MTRRILLVLAAVAVLLGAVPSAAVARSTVTRSARSEVRLDATVNGTRLRDPIAIHPDRLVTVRVAVRNDSPETLHVRSVRLSGAVLGLDFFVFEAATRLSIPAGQTRQWTMEIQVDSLEGQATGLLPLSLTLVDEDRDTIGTVEGTADVHASVISAYGLFGLGTLVVTVLLWAAVLVALARRRLPVNRAMRGLRFVPAGFGLGLSTVIGLSVLRITAPTTASEFGYLIGLAAGAFVLGYLTPTPRPGPPRPPAAVAAPASDPERTQPAGVGAPERVPPQERRW
ncbi:hypothetical protein [Cryptosporangium sp. NPDC051539]|uniref:hypothetical protein n=1 Tax=Cryptosporangium sp. NPDC051539 TaxID=3363962 RepID=UPI0037AEFBAA